jgi:nucleotide-binding universal stress UspA family protein
MDEKHLRSIPGIDADDWEQTPASIRKIVVQLTGKVEQLEQRLKELEIENQQLREKSHRHSGNSHSPPASDPPDRHSRKKKKPTGKKRGGQPGHAGHSRPLYPVEECSSVTDYYPKTCAGCGEPLQGVDPNPYRHQVVEIPPIQLHIEEHRLHQLTCLHCSEKTRAALPEAVEVSGYGERVVAIVSVLSGMYRHSVRMVVSAMSDLFGVKLSLGTVNRLRKEASEAVSETVEEAKAYVQSAPIVGADETGFGQGNADGQNPHSKRAWLWVAVTPLVVFFQVMLSRSTAAAQALLGENFGGILNSDRYNAYNWVDVGQRQLCWAHLKREFTKISERSGISRQLGRDLLAQQKKLFRLWHRIRDGTLTWAEFQALVSPIRARVSSLLFSGADYQIGSKEKTPLAKTVRTCRQLLKVEPALWLFVTVQGLEPTNNAAERAIRPAVLWRRTSFGSQSESGSVFVALMLTVVTSLRSQNRNVLEFMTDAVRASRQGSPSPSLLPQEDSSTASSMSLAA